MLNSSASTQKHRFVQSPRFTLNANRGINVDTNGGTIDVVGGAAMTYGGFITGSGSFTKTDGGTLVLNGTTPSNYTGR